MVVRSSFYIRPQNLCCFSHNGIERLGVHALRHTFATRVLESGMDARTLSEILGHAKVALTLQLYAHSSIETKRSTMENMDVFI